MKQIAPHQIRHSHIVRVGGENVWDDTLPTFEHVFDLGTLVICITSNDWSFVFGELRGSITRTFQAVHSVVESELYETS